MNEDHLIHSATISRNQAFVRDHLSPLVAAAKDNAYRKWNLEYMTGAEAKEVYNLPEFEHIIDGDEYVVATVLTLQHSTMSDTDPGADLANAYRYYINVSLDSAMAIAYDTIKALLSK